MSVICMSRVSIYPLAHSNYFIDFTHKICVFSAVQFALNLHQVHGLTYSWPHHVASRSSARPRAMQCVTTGFAEHVLKLRQILLPHGSLATSRLQMLPLLSVL